MEKLKTDYKTTGIIVARFQVAELHIEHKALIEKVRQYHKKVFLFLGTSSVKTDKNPLDYPTRVKMILNEYPDIICLPIADVESDQLWVSNLETMIKSVESTKKVILYGGRDSFIDYYKNNGGKFGTVELCSTFDISGTEKREAISNEVKDSSDFRQGIIYSMMAKFPTVYPTVDIIITRYKGTNDMEYLVGKKHTEIQYSDKWRFIGGFIENSHGGKPIDSAIGEVKEEAGIDITSNMLNYIGQYFIDDWRYRGTKDSIMTTLYHVDITDHPCTIDAGDDIAELAWISQKDIPTVIRRVHKNLLNEFTKTIIYNGK